MAFQKSTMNNSAVTVIGLLIITTTFVVTRFPFFFLLFVPGIAQDSGEYYNVLSIIEQNVDKVVGHPQIGYPIFLKLCEQISDTLWCVTAIQSILSLVACGYFYIVFSKTFSRWELFTAILLAGYLSSAMTIRWDTFIYPDSILASLYLICSALLMEIIINRKAWMILLYMPTMTFAIAVRPSGLILIPPIVVAVSLYFWRTKDIVLTTTYFSSGVVCLLILSSIHFFAPSHKQFGIFVRPPIKKSAKIVNRGTNHELLKKLAEIVPHNEIILASRFNSLTNPDSISLAYLTYFKQAVRIGFGRIDRDTVMYYRTGIGELLDLDSMVSEIGDEIAYEKFRATFKEVFADSIVTFGRKKELGSYAMVHTPKFFRYFTTAYKSSESKTGSGNFYTVDVWSRLKSHHVDMDWISYSLKDHTLIALDQVTRRTAKEVMRDAPMSLEDARFQFIGLTSSTLYKWIIKPLYSVHHSLFRNFLYIIALFTICILSVIYIAAKGIDNSSIAIYTLLICSMLFATLFLHVFYMKLIYSRYTHQISFVYYIAVIMLPPLVTKLRETSQISTHD